MGFLVNCRRRGLDPRWSLLVALLMKLVVLTSSDGIKLPDQTDAALAQSVEGRASAVPAVSPVDGEGRRQGKHLLDFVGLGTGPNVDPYLGRTNAQCLNGELADCFKSQALNTFTDFFARDEYQLTSEARIVRLPETQVRSLQYEGFEYSEEPRQLDSEWDQLYKFGLRQLERFVKSTALEFEIPEDLTEGGRYSARFIDEISDEIDVIEDKKAPLFTRHRLKKIFIPLLIILKIFKLKLLFFLPVILGLASFKKLLGFAAIIIPGIIGYLKLFRPNQSCCTNDLFANNYQPQYSPQGVGSVSYNPFKPHQSHYSRPGPNFASPYGNYYRDGTDLKGGSVKFGDEQAYQGYSEYRNNDKDIKAEKQ
ncbi:uncharacterized protein LOC129718112 [Wyeomyia smithii]|uniref:uncharacterized protein LOC129718112 n=1 Tax=Wyeomyia smithii TaxID=174621 RepID=UPI0024681024|nr:uncharacterized protein LOC129718112 [Wyeomyia smithii]XP_055524509.1 uncharacterized protein LOC129718112 [Wyeomyia smithii]XP_055524510.1 uncharacterized protein LOC129718112 [Wyeomyia smithii]XP_055524511.1 uncharacterized protein LOC129718112 [Wyeomyia smithii]XP_055524512.1 uncharacterized protein LOC129718112 [Wyeomyia smithii]XP_055524513.1 uncharacterized protein LOC129718112 [Wyeomyia smithii]